jgi:2'-5' RNA ligase
MSKRLFIALPLSAPAIAELHALVHMCRRQATVVRWVRPEQMHITLKFLGDVEEERECDITGALESLTTEKPFMFNLAGVGAFPDQRKPRVIWTGIVTGKDEVSALAKRVDDLLFAKKFPREERGFSPHVTIGRVKEPGEFGALWKTVEATPFVGMNVDAHQVLLIHSTLTPQGPVYKDLAVFPLRGGAK